MAWQLESDPVEGSTAVLTPDELVVHLREAGAKRVYLSRTDAFRGGAIPITATYEFDDSDSMDGSDSDSVRKMLTSVFESIGDRLWFHDRSWALEWSVKPAFTEPQLDLMPLYDRGVEQKYTDGFTLGNLHCVYEEWQELQPRSRVDNP